MLVFYDFDVGEVFSENVIHEGDSDIEHAGTETSAGVESDRRRPVEFSRSWRLAGVVNQTSPAHLGGLS